MSIDVSHGEGYLFWCSPTHAYYDWHGSPSPVDLFGARHQWLGRPENICLTPHRSEPLHHVGQVQVQDARPALIAADGKWEAKVQQPEAQRLHGCSRTALASAGTGEHRWTKTQSCPKLQMFLLLLAVAFRANDWLKPSTKYVLHFPPELLNGAPAHPWIACQEKINHITLIYFFLAYQCVKRKHIGHELLVIQLDFTLSWKEEKAPSTRCNVLVAQPQTLMVWIKW